MIPIIRDTCGRKYELHMSGLISRPSRGSSARYLILRKDLRDAFKLNRRDVTTWNGCTSVDFQFFTYDCGSLEIGCRHFLRGAGRKLKNWAVKL